jgi:hypothetical protein
MRTFSCSLFCIKTHGVGYLRKQLFIFSPFFSINSSYNSFKKMFLCNFLMRFLINLYFFSTLISHIFFWWWKHKLLMLFTENMIYIKMNVWLVTYERYVEGSVRLFVDECESIHRCQHIFRLIRILFFLAQSSRAMYLYSQWNLHNTFTKKKREKYLFVCRRSFLLLLTAWLLGNGLICKLLFFFHFWCFFSRMLPRPPMFISITSTTIYHKD